ncbi:MAG: protein-disulfide reductase DsbD domain-containing protein [Pseudomonadota bacterium]
MNRGFAALTTGSLQALLLVAALSLSTVGGKANSQELPDRASGPHINVSLVSETDALRVGRNWLGVYLEPDTDWHTYWRNPGDSGEAPSIEWSLPNGIEAGDILWPLPHAIPVAHLVNYGYEGAVLLMVPIDVGASASPGPVAITASISWLVCQEDCVPGWADLELRLELADEPGPSVASPLFAQTRERLPVTTPLSARHEVTDAHIVVSITDSPLAAGHLFPFDSSVVQHAAAQESTSDGDATVFVLPRSEYFTATNSDLTFLMSDGVTAYPVTSALNGSVALAATGSTIALPVTLLMAFLGGLILNLMPCVLPILSMKALSLQSTATSGLAKWAYALGVVVCFNAFATVVIGLQAAGESVGWGFHLQQPWVIAVLAFLFTAIALLLLDVITTSGRFGGMGQSLVQGGGFSGQFFTGVLAVIVASPCTAPFMAAALGVALVSTAPVSFAIFNALAVGFALPLTLIFVSPPLRRLLPKPGAWMETFKQFLAFPMLATVVWLVWVYLQQTSAIAQFALLASLLCFAMFCWFIGKARGGFMTGVLTTAALATVAIAVQLTPPAIASTAKVRVDAFSTAKLAALRADNQVVFVNMTADWCITCKVNEQVALSSNELKGLLDSDEVHYLVGDWTNKNDEYLNYLNDNERSGVPFYAVYPGQGPAVVLPQILTTDTVMTAINLAIEKVHHE